MINFLMTIEYLVDACARTSKSKLKSYRNNDPIPYNYCHMLTFVRNCLVRGTCS